MKSELDVKITAGLAIIIFAILAVKEGENFAGEVFSVFSSAISYTVVARLLYVKWLWKTKLFRWLECLHGVPYLEGIWAGEYHSTGNPNTPADRLKGAAEVEIRQPNIHTIKVIRRSNESTSRSFGEEIVKGEDGITQLIYSYRSEPKATVRDRSPISYGSARLTLTRETVRKLEGDYWSDQKTTGTLDLTKKENT